MAQSKPQGSSKVSGTSTRSSGRRGTRASALRRPPEKGWPRFRHELGLRWEATLELWPLWLALFLAIAVWALLPRRILQVPQVREGDVATRTYIADRDISVVDEAATAELKKKAEEEVLPVYDFNGNLALSRALQLDQLFKAGQAILAAKEEKSDAAREPPASEDPETAPDLATELAAASGLKVTATEADWLLARGFPEELEERLRSLVVGLLQQGVVGDKTLLLEHRASGILVQRLPSGEVETDLDLYRYYDYPDQVREAVGQELRGWSGLKRADREVLTSFLVANVTPNLTLNSSESLARKKAAAESVGRVSHNTRKGEVILRRGEVATGLQAQTITEMIGDEDQSRVWLSGAGALFLGGGAAALVWLVSGLARRRDRSRVRLFNECLILLGVHVVGARFAFFVAAAIAGSIESEPWNSLESYVWGIPFASLALLGVLLYERSIATVLGVVFAFLAGPVVGGEAPWAMTLYALVGSLTAVFALDTHHFQERSVMIRAGWVVGLVNLAAVVTLKALAGDVAGGLAELGFDFLCALVGGLLAAAVASFGVAIFESLFALTSYIKLLELSNTNLPLLRRLALEAPGTFQHSLAVANLAKAGCEAIGLDSVLVHTAALYHDIGKVFRPQYFVENQAPGQNPHDKVQPTMSALILINHVKDGLELAVKHRLPQPLIDAIAEHHGTRLITFFYKRAQERSDPETDEVREDDFRYPGPKPQSKEMGILMLADGVEAASRTLVEPSQQKIRTLLKKLMSDCLEDHQLDQTDLTLGDLGRVEEAFLKVLTNIYHRRIDYPGFDFNQPSKPQGSKSSVIGGKLGGQAPAEEIGERKAS